MVEEAGFSYEELLKGDTRYCWFCAQIAPYIENEECKYVCLGCGTVDAGPPRDFDMHVPYDRPDPYAKKFGLFRSCADPWHRRSVGRYKEKFHLNERISQWRCRDPCIPAGDWALIQAAADSGLYGAKENFTRATVITVTRDLKLQKYRERWKSILRKLEPEMVDTEMIEDEMIPGLSIQFNRFVEVFGSLKTQMPKSITRKKGGEVKPRDRHNFISYNYVLRKELEMQRIWAFHEEFPVPRSHTKLHALDDIMEKMCAELKLPFVRSAVIKRPKLKRK